MEHRPCVIIEDIQNNKDAYRVNKKTYSMSIRRNIDLINKILIYLTTVRKRIRLKNKNKNNNYLNFITFLHH